MPKSPSSSSHTDGDTDGTVRKRRNARGQATFRAKRSQYIASLEETVLRLETALVQCQDSWRGFQDEIYKLKEDNEKMRQEQKEHEALLQRLYLRGEAPELADLLQADPSFSPILGDVIKLLPQPTSSPVRAHQTNPIYPPTSSTYRSEGSSLVAMSQSSFASPSAGPPNTVQQSQVQAPIVYNVPFQHSPTQFNQFESQRRTL